MNRFAFCVLALAFAGACQKIDDTKALHDEAAALVPYYQAEVDKLDDRLTALVRRGLKLDRPLPGSDDAGKLVQQANAQLAQLHQMLADLPKELAAGPDAFALAKLVDTSRAKLDEGTDAVGGELGVAEAWVARAEVDMKALPATVSATPPSAP